MTLNQLRQLLTLKPLEGAVAAIWAVTEDSRRVQPGTVFVAAHGEQADGHDFAASAVAAGAVAVVGDRVGVSELHGVPYLYAAQPRIAAGLIAHVLAGNPTKAMTVVGVTGTNGKSSVVTLLHHILNACGRSTACFGTLGYTIGGETTVSKHTTPFGEDLAQLFRRAKEVGHTHGVMEVSSHSLAQERVAGIEFQVGAFTNLTQDHLDYHQDMESYRRAKLKLFERIEGSGCFTVVNREDPAADGFIAASKAPCYTYGQGGDCHADEVRMEVNRTSFRAVTPWGAANIETRLLGMHNVSNVLCAVTIGGGLGLELSELAAAVATLRGVPGRFEHVDAGQNFQVIVDYAHTEDGLRNVLRAARAICPGRVILAFGCGGDRDRTKRPKMAGAAAELADFSIITSDNPRTESPERILLDIESGIQHAGMKRAVNYEVIPDRAQAIRHAIGLAKAGDLVMIAGKGHEDYQIVGTERIHFDDREVARQILEGQ